jgi:acetolactate synthase-1/2/3 large subunit
MACPDRVVVSLVGDGGFGQNPAVLSTAREQGIAVVWVVMNNNAFGTIAGLEKAAFDTTYGTVFGTADDPLYTDFAAIAEAYGVTGIKVESAAEFKPALERAIALERPVVIDVSMVNVPTPTTGHWNILDIYAPGETVEHVATP